MRKKIGKAAVVSLVVGCLSMASISIVAMAKGNAYEDYKSAVLQTVLSGNMTVQADATVSVDGSNIMIGENIVKVNGQDSYTLSKMDINGQVVEIEQSHIGNKEITRIGEQYTVETSSADSNEHEDFSQSSNSLKLMNTVADLLIGDAKTQFISNGDQISVSLEGAQIPQVLNVAVSAILARSSKSNDIRDNEDETFKDALTNLPITSNIAIQSINMTANVAKGYIMTNNFTIVISGTNDIGNSHTLELNVDAVISDINNTSVNIIDTKGKDVTIIQEND